MKIDINIQRPPRGPFTRDALHWDESKTAHIPDGRFVDFVIGEQLRLSEKTVFLIQQSWRNAPGPSRNVSEDAFYSEKRIYHCAYGPGDDDLRYDLSYSADEEAGTKPNIHNIMKLGCQCKFEYRKLRQKPQVACIYFEEMRHVTTEGYPCHGVLDPGFLDCHRFAHRISVDMRLWIFNRLQAKDATVAKVMAEHREDLLNLMQEKGVNYCTQKDDFLREADIRNVKNSVSKGTWKYLPQNVGKFQNNFTKYDDYRRYPRSRDDVPPNTSPETDATVEPEETTLREQRPQFDLKRKRQESSVGSYSSSEVGTSRRVC